MPMPARYPIPPTLLIITIILGITILNVQLINFNIFKSWATNSIFFLFVIILSVDILSMILFGVGSGLRLFLGRSVLFSITLFTLIFCNSYDKLIFAIKLVLISTCVLALLVIISSVFGIDTGGLNLSGHGRNIGGSFLPYPRSAGIANSFGETGIILCYALSFLLYNTISTSQIISRKVSVVLLLIILFAIFLTQSRSSWLAASTTISTIFLFKIITMYDIRVKTAIFLLIAGLGIIFLWTEADTLLKFIDLLLGEGRNKQNAINRMANFTYGLEFLSHYSQALFGVGAADAGNMIGEYLGEGQNSHIGIHNFFVYQLVSSGIIVLLAWTIIFIISIIILIDISVNGEKQIKHISIPLLASLIATVVELNFYKGFFCEMLSLQLGYYLVVYNIYMSNKQHWPTIAYHEKNC